MIVTVSNKKQANLLVPSDGPLKKALHWSVYRFHTKQKNLLRRGIKSLSM